MRGEALRRQYEQMSTEVLVDVMRRWCRNESDAAVESFIAQYEASHALTDEQRERATDALVALAIRYYNNLFWGISRS